MSEPLHGILADWIYSGLPPGSSAPTTAGQAIRLQRSLFNDELPLETDPFFPAVQETAKWLLSKHAKRVFINADYDVDGTASAAILHRLFSDLGADVEVFIPSRFHDNYGVNIDKIQQAHAETPIDFLVCVDCGAASLPELDEFATRSGASVLVIDHHPPVERGERIWELNPHRHPSIDTAQYCAGLLSCMLSQAVKQEEHRQACHCEESVLLGGLAVIGDVVSVMGIAGRYAARYCIKNARSSEASLGLKTLVDLCCQLPWLSAADFGYLVCPPINAAGRLDRADRALELFLTRDPERAKALGTELKELNRRRQELQSDVEVDARGRFKPGISVLIEHDHRWHQGVVGPAAGRLSEEFNIPVLLGGYSEEQGFYLFSGRSRSDEVHLYRILQEVLSGKPVQFGGHKAAVGMKVATQHVDSVVEHLRSSFCREIAIKSRKPQRAYSLRLWPSSVGIKLWKEINDLGPFGPGNEEPAFVIRDTELKLKKSKNRLHSARGKAVGLSASGTPHEFQVVVHDKPGLANLTECQGSLLGHVFLDSGPRGAQVCFRLEDYVPACS